MKVNPRIGIITWHYYPNFGSALQTYALHKFINNHGGKAEIINYIPRKREKFYSIRLFFSVFDKYLPYQVSRCLHYRFIAFSKNYFQKSECLYKNLEDLKLTNKLYDIFICGSDQIWAPNVFDEAYMLSFVENNKKKYSYAASIGLPNIPKTLESIYYTLLHKFNKISVREEQGKELLKELFNIKAQVVCDPTLLLTRKDWQQISRNTKFSGKYKDKYILCYFLGNNKVHRDIAEKLASSLNFKIISLSRDKNNINSQTIIESDAGPSEFISYINNAKLVITDSYHGLCFSINFNKEFYVVKRFADNDPLNQNSRILSLLQRLGLQSRLIEKVPESFEKINYQIVENRLNEFRSLSIEYLNSLEIY